MMLFAQFVTGLLFGGMVYVTVLVAPIIFIVLSESDATEFTRTMWPRYFTINAVLSALAGVVCLTSSAAVYRSLPLLVTALLMGVNLGFAVQMQSLREPGETYEEGGAYDWMHTFTVWSNALCILLVGGFFGYSLIYPV